MNTILLIDGTNSFMRNYIVVPSLDKNGNPVGGLLGFLRSLRYTVDMCKPQKVIIVFDGQNGSARRRKTNPDYKAGRKPLRINRSYEYDNEDIDRNKQYQFTRLLQYLQDLPVSIVIIDDIEADDAIAFLARYYDQDRKLLVSDDRDFFQLLSHDTIIFRPTSKQFYNIKNLQEEFNVFPCNFALLKSLAGDKSDNIKGIQGIGFKNALKYFPFLAENKQFEIKDIIEYAELKMSSGDKKYNKFVSAKDILINNLQVMQLYDPIISAGSIGMIKEATQLINSFSMTGFRIKMIQDGLSEINDSYFQAFKPLAIREERKIL